MKKNLSLFSVVVLSFILAGYPNHDELSDSPSVKPERFKTLLKLKPGLLSTDQYVHSLQEINSRVLRDLMTEYDVCELRAVFRNRYDDDGKLRPSVTNGNELETWQEIIVENKDAAFQLVERLKYQPEVLYAMIEKPVDIKPSIVPNDTQYNSQWAYRNSVTWPNADIDAEAAWDINRGRNDVVVAVLDGGVDYTHPDLDDGTRTRVIAGTDTGDGDNDPMDNLPGDGFAGHGTLVAGVIGARTDNANQVAGVMWNCQIMPVKMVRNGGIRIPHIVDWDWDEGAFPSDVADAIDYATNHGAHVVNLSYSFPSMGWLVNEVIFKIPMLFDAIDNAYKNNVVITASMGNEFQTDNGVRYPAGFREQVMAVGATNAQGAKTNFSNTGNHISISAPGEGILTTERGGGTKFVNGTSFSAPMVAGVAGLVISQGKDRGFNLTNDDVRHILELTATDDAVTPGYDVNLGHGIVNARRALQLIAEPNVLYHQVATGTGVKITNYTRWITTSGRWGLAAAAYLDVDQYEFTKHVNFNVPFCSTPTVWMRERESLSMNYGNPNNGQPYSVITNVTPTGFDLKYVGYYVRYDVQGRTLNKWIPTVPADTRVAFTAVGVPDYAAVAGPVAGPATICGGGTFQLSNPQPGQTTTWRVVPSGYFTTSTGTGPVANLTMTSPSARGSATVMFTVTGACGRPFSYSKTFWAGTPNITRGQLTSGELIGWAGIQNSVCNLQQQTTDMAYAGHTSRTWQRVSGNPTNTQWSQSGDNISFYFWAVGQTATFRVTLNNTCGSSVYDFAFKSINCNTGGGPCSSQFQVSPNPSSSFKDGGVIVMIPAPCPSSASSSAEVASRGITGITVYNENGLVVFSETFTRKKQYHELDIKNFSKGTYYLKIADSDYSETQRIAIGD